MRRCLFSNNSWQKNKWQEQQKLVHFPSRFAAGFDSSPTWIAFPSLNTLSSYRYEIWNKLWLVKWEIKWNCEKGVRLSRICLLQSSRVAQARADPTRNLKIAVWGLPYLAHPPSSSSSPFVLLVLIEVAIGCNPPWPPQPSTPTPQLLIAALLSPYRLPYFTISLWNSRRVEYALMGDGGEIGGWGHQDEERKVEGEQTNRLDRHRENGWELRYIL